MEENIVVWCGSVWWRKAWKMKIEGSIVVGSRLVWWRNGCKRGVIFYVALAYKTGVETRLNSALECPFLKRVYIRKFFKTEK
ncbi:hypothetical protein [Pedobacter cryoconitis]|uniref:hypothetical protein n=1 Tax=Pedobacter cryoconitis TaxID=188932 RepID=UPI00083972EC|nr:hypothetical protein [Pedobacter cryoconitis]